MARELAYAARLIWTGAAPGYARDFRFDVAGKPAIVGSADPHFGGDPALHNPEELLLASLASCHMLTYLALCEKARLPLLAYEDRPTGTVAMKDGRMRFTEVVLYPRVRLGPGGDGAKARALHASAADYCFIANSVSFPVRHEPEIVTTEAMA
ncbi:MAG: OsmC family protein [Alphaproteobacteria bacterium]